MIVKDFREWINLLPTDYDEFKIVYVIEHRDVPCSVSSSISKYEIDEEKELILLRQNLRPKK